MRPFFSAKLAQLILLALILAVPASSQQPAPQPAQQPAAPQKKFDPPRIIAVVHSVDTGALSGDQADASIYYINKGQDAYINRGEVLNVYREKRLHPNIPRPLRIFIGTMTITESQIGSSVGKFNPNAAILSQTIIKYKIPLIGDIVVPRLIIDSGVLFDPGLFNLKPGAAQEFQKVADFVQNFSPSKIIIEGHTDSDGDDASNLMLSENRAQAVTQFIINAYNFITPAMVEARGYGEEKPIVNNDTPENKALNRRIEVVVWE